MITDVSRQTVKALIVDDHALIRKSLSNILTGLPDVICHQAENGKIALEKCRTEPYNIIFLDISMPVMDGITTMFHLQQEFPQSKVIILTMQENKRQFIELMEMGVSGYLLKDTDEAEVTRAMHLVMDGHKYITPSLYKTWTDYICDKDLGKPSIRYQVLTARELEILRMICMQLSASEIAGKLFVSESTINNHRSSIMKKTDIHNTVGLVIYAITNGIFKPGIG